jgi:hypothetical protein
MEICLGIAKLGHNSAPRGSPMRRPVVLAVLSLAALAAAIPAAEAQDRRRPGEGLSITVRPRYSRTSTRKLGKVERRDALPLIRMARDSPC